MISTTLNLYKQTHSSPAWPDSTVPAATANHELRQMAPAGMQPTPYNRHRSADDRKATEIIG